MDKRFALAVVYFSGLADWPRVVQVGGLSALGALTSFYCVVSWALWAVTPGIFTRVRLFSVCYVLFLAWAWISLAWSPSARNGLQNVGVMTAFAGGAFLCSKQRVTCEAFALRVQRAATTACAVAGLLYVISLLARMTGRELSFVSARGFALFALLGLCQLLSRWRYSSPQSLWWALLLTALIGASLCRTAFFVALLLFPLAQRPSKGLREALRVALWTCFVVLVAWVSVSHVESIERRFFSGDLSLRLAGVRVNASGRTAFWGVTLQSTQDNILAGRGAGAVEALMNAHFLDIEHPHSEYLRVLHDYGIIGLGLFLLSIGTTLAYLSTSWARNDKHAPDIAAIQLSAILSLVATGLTMLTDNALVYVYVMAPLGIIVGTAVAITDRSRLHSFITCSARFV